MYKMKPQQPRQFPSHLEKYKRKINCAQIEQKVIYASYVKLVAGQFPSTSAFFCYQDGTDATDKLSERDRWGKNKKEILRTQSRPSAHTQSYLASHLAASALSDYVTIIQTAQLSRGFAGCPMPARLAC